jgi:hypothetical protein
MIMQAVAGTDVAIVARTLPKFVPDIGSPVRVLELPQDVAM